MPFVPDLAVEVFSPTDQQPELTRKRLEFHEAGTPSVWIVYPDSREVYCFETGNRTPRVYGMGDTLTDPVLPGFELKIDGLFPPVQIDQPKT